MTPVRMDIERRAVNRLEPWYSAIFEDAATSRTVNEWGALAKRALLITGVAIALSFVIGVSLGVDSGIHRAAYGGVWVLLTASCVLALKTALASQNDANAQ